MKQTRRLSIDTVLLLVLGTASISLVSQLIGALIILTIGSYVLLDTLSRVKTIPMSLQRVFNLKLSLVMLSIFLVTVFPTMSAILMRQATTAWRYIRDGMALCLLPAIDDVPRSVPVGSQYGEAMLAGIWSPASDVHLLLSILQPVLPGDNSTPSGLGLSATESPREGTDMKAELETLSHFLPSLTLFLSLIWHQAVHRCLD